MDGVTNSSKNRFLSPIRRCVIAKIPHIALVLPCLDKIKRKIEDKMSGFIWQGAEKVARADAKKSFKKLGLKIPDLQASWRSERLI